MDKNLEQRLEVLDQKMDALRRMIEALDATVKTSLVHHAEERILGAKEVADMLTIEVEEVHRLCRNGTLPSFKIGKYYKFRKTEVLDWIKNRKKDEVGSVDDFVNKYLQRRPLRG